VNPHVAVVGGGILGSVTALLLANQGVMVTLFEAEAKLMNAASGAGEGKIHLGLVYPLGDDSTRLHMLEGALSFSPVIERAIGRPIDWPTITTPGFLNLVMPDSLVSLSELGNVYSNLNREFVARQGRWGNAYLGHTLDALFEPEPVQHRRSGLWGFQTQERAVVPAELAGLVTESVANHPNVETRFLASVSEMRNTELGVVVSWGHSSGANAEEFSMAINCTWQNQMRFVSAERQAKRNIRFKTSISIPNESMPPHSRETVTLVTGPYGDVVAYPQSTYVSWYPVGRLAHEETEYPSEQMASRVDEGMKRTDVVVDQVTHLATLGFLPNHEEIDLSQASISGGYIVGEGHHDIDQRDSGLHDRHHRDAIREGNIVTPVNFKFSTAPLESQRVVDEIIPELSK
jgi:hypothetical protein